MMADFIAICDSEVELIDQINAEIQREKDPFRRTSLLACRDVAPALSRANFSARDRGMPPENVIPFLSSLFASLLATAAATVTVGSPKAKRQLEEILVLRIIELLELDKRPH